MAGEEPVEKGRAGAPDMEVSGRTRCESCSYHGFLNSPGVDYKKYRTIHQPYMLSSAGHTHLKNVYPQIMVMASDSCLLTLLCAYIMLFIRRCFMRITVHVPDKVGKEAQRLAENEKKSVSSIVAQSIEFFIN
jgi:hypothetical protein